METKKNENKLSQNKTYNMMIEILLKNKEIDSKRKQDYLSYATNIKKYNYENVKEIELKDILDDIRNLNEYFKESDEISLVKDRIAKEIEIINMINELYNNPDKINLKEYIETISEELDMLYLQTDLKVRKNSGLTYTLVKKEK